MQLNTQPEPIACPLCGHTHNKSVLIARPDYEYGVTASLPYIACTNAACGLVFVADIPAPDQIQSFYSRYSTHQQAKSSGSILARFGNAARDRQLRDVLAGKDMASSKVLDFGCGSGNFLMHLKSLGACNVYGYDFDPEACKCAEQAGAVAFSSEERMRECGPYDFIFLNHVIEHLSAPQAELQKLQKHLVPGGKLVLRTPNSGSLLARLFGASWRGWETPRHLHIFNRRNIAALLPAGTAETALTIREQSTSNAMFAGMYHESFHAPFWREMTVGKLLRHAMCFPLFAIGAALNSISGELGEEVVFVLESTGR